MVSMRLVDPLRVFEYSPAPRLFSKLREFMPQLLYEDGCFKRHKIATRIIFCPRKKR